MMEPYVAYAAIIISFLTLLLNFFSYRSRISEVEEAQLKEEFKTIKEWNAKLGASYLQLLNHVQHLNTEVAVLKEKVNNEIILLEKLEDKLEDIIKENK